MSFRVKLIALCLFLSSVGGAISAVAINGLTDIGRQNARITEKVMPKLEELNNMFLEYRRVRISLRTLGINGISKEDEAAAIRDAEDAIAEYNKHNDVYVALGFLPGQKELYDKLHASWLNYFNEVGKRALALHKSGDRTALTALFLKDCPEAAHKYTAAAHELFGFHDDVKKAAIDGSRSEQKSTERLVLFFAVGGILVGLTIGTLISTRVSRAISSVAGALAENAQQVAASSVQIAASSESLSQATTEQAASLEQTTASLQQISAMIEKTSANAETSATSSAESQAKANDGHQAVEEMMRSMDEISQSNDAIMNQINESNQKLSEIVRVIREIGEKTKVINEIVFQTKLLSFNASVEAARAGEHGKGFAVVAEEVGNLAQMSGNAAKDISDMLSGSIVNVENIVEDTKRKVAVLIDQGKLKVESGTVVAQRCATLLGEIVDNVSRVSSLASEISQASREQSLGVGEINSAVVQLDTVTQQNASTSEETAESARLLSSQAASLKTAVDQLLATIHGEGKTLDAALSAEAEASREKPTAKVISIASTKKTPASSAAPSTPRLKRAAGDPMIPAHDDKRFSDV
ncbi:MAG: methyl-accepting chemotaxis protein [Bdellovibrionaceae bacterium]|nr:methyl-accepting chemotaxis protein [Pseudobdellovibrionaceae bacterium]